MEDNSNFHIVIHFDLNKTIVPLDPYDQVRSIENFAADVISTRAWGEVTFNEPDAPIPENATPQEKELIQYANSTWTLKSDELSFEPIEGLMSFKQYIEKKMPRKLCTTDEEMDAEQHPLEKYDFIANEGKALQTLYEKLIKSLKLPSGSVVDSELGLHEDIMKCYNSRNYYIIPSFFKTLLYLKKHRGNFSISFRTHGRELHKTIDEFNAFCEGKHPAFNGEGGTRLVKLDGSKPGSKDFRIHPRQTGMFFRFGSDLNEIDLLMNTIERQNCETHDQLIEHYGGQIEEGTLNLFDGSIDEIYAVLNDICRKHNSMAIRDDHWRFWLNNKNNDFGKLLVIDQSDFSQQHIFFDDGAVVGPNSNIDVRELSTGHKISEKKFRDKYVVRADIYKACMEHDYFIKKIEECERRRDQEIERLQMGALSEDDNHAEVVDNWDKTNEQYLLKTIMPLLYQGMNFIATERPQNPIEFLALYMLQNQHLVNIPKAKVK